MIPAEFSAWLDSLSGAAARLAGATESKIIGILVAFRDKRGELNWNLTKLQNNPPLVGSPASLLNDYARTLAAAQDAKRRADWLGKIADTFTNVTGLGALPAIVAGVPVGVLLAAAAALTYTMTQVVAAVSRYMAAKQISETTAAQGGNAASAVERYYNRTAASGTLFGDAAQVIWPAAIVLGAYLILSKRR